MEHLSIKEQDKALTLLIKPIQVSQLEQDYICLRQERELNSKSNLLCFSPFMDQEGLVRVGGRLKKSSFSFNKRYLILLPKHHFTELIQRHEFIYTQWWA